jgi:hypothetical protein
MEKNDTCECAICYEPMKNGLQKWKCGHRFHNACLEQWDHSCPLCRNDELIEHELPEITWSISRNRANVLNIESMKNIHRQVPVEKRLVYKQGWKDRDCLSRGHTMHYFQPYGVVVICETCNTVQSYALMH